MQKLNFNVYEFRFKNSKNKLAIFDEVRKKFMILTPEEWVRQHVIKFLNIEKKYPLSLINVEKKILINGRIKRYDIIIFCPKGNVFAIIECKAPHVTISQETFNQIARYNMTLKANFLMVTNGLQHYYCKIASDNNAFDFLKDFPDYNTENI
jgi:type I site-specific restriction endonuclease